MGKYFNRFYSESVNSYLSKTVNYSLSVTVEPVFGFLKANLSFSRFSVRGKSKVENELGFALMAVNLRKYTAMSNKDDYKPVANRSKKRTESKFSLIQSVFTYRRRVLKGFVPASIMRKEVLYFTLNFNFACLFTLECQH